MKNKLLVMILSLMGGLMLNLMVVTTPVMAKSCEDKTFLGFRPWYAGLEKNDDCSVKGPKSDTDGKEIAKFIWVIVLNITSSAMGVAGMVVLFMIIYGGFLQMSSRGDQAAVVRGKKVMANAIIGLIIVAFATIVVNTVISVLTAKGGS